MTGNEYQNLSMRTNDGGHYERLDNALFEDRRVAEVINGCLGLSGETGELLDMIKKWIFHSKAFNETHAKKEIGDVMWYVALLCHAFGWDLDEIMKMNVEKLKARYPEGFDTEKSNHRESGDI